MGRPTSQSIFLSSLGLFIAGYIFYSSSLIETFYATEFNLSSWQIGIAQACVPFGAMLGAILAGQLADFFGRQTLLVWNFLAICVIAILSIFSFDFYSLSTCRLINGFLAGTIYPLCAAYMTEMSGESSQARHAAILMFINCLAAPIAAVITMILAPIAAPFFLWRIILCCGALPALLAFLLARNAPESKAWAILKVQNRAEQKIQTLNLKQFFNPTYRYITFCLLGSWFLMDVAYYGINFFVPYLLQQFTQHFNSIVNDEILFGSLVINIFFMLGAFGAIFIVRKNNLIALQKYGFFFASLSLFLLAGYFYSGLHYPFIIIFLFVIFNLALNLGPDVTTYLLSATSYPVEIRGSGHGLNAGIAKFGSFLGVLLLPHWQEIYGYQFVIMLLAFLLLLAFGLTIYFSKILTKEIPEKITQIEAQVIYETTN